MSPALAGGFFTIEPPGKPEDKCMKGIKEVIMARQMQVIGFFFCKKYQHEPQKEKKMKKVKALCNNHRGVPDDSVVNNPPAVQEIQETGV